MTRDGGEPEITMSATVKLRIEISSNCREIPTFYRLKWRESSDIECEKKANNNYSFFGNFLIEL